ncbi:MAG: excinuclease ABC subunit UvrA, partial [Brevibacterium linens]
HVREIDAEGIDRVNVVDATPIGINVRSTVATYSGVLDDLRRTYARLDSAKNAGLKAGDFSYNTGTLRCPKCEGTGEITLDVQFLPDVDIPCPDCEGRRFSPDADEHCRASDADGRPLSLPDLLAMTVAEALPHLGDIRKVHARLRALQDVGLGYLTLHEATPALSGGEAQRLKLATELGKSQQHTLFVFDEPTVGLHPEDVRVLVRVFQQLLDQGGTVLVIEHDLDMIANADWIIDLGPGGGHDGGRIVATGTPGQVADAAHSVTGEYLRAHLQPDSAE